MQWFFLRYLTCFTVNVAVATLLPKLGELVARGGVKFSISDGI